MLPTDEAVVAREVIVDDLALLELLESQIAETETQLETMLPDTPPPPATGLTAHALDPDLTDLPSASSTQVPGSG